MSIRAISKRELYKQIKEEFENKEISKDIKEIIDYTKISEKEYPIPVVKIAKNLGFIVVKQELDEDFRGYMAVSKKIEKKFGKDKIICVNSNDNLEYQRFTIAYEIVQYWLKFKKNTDDKNDINYYDVCRTTDINDGMEEQVNDYVINLLMPFKEFSRKYIELSNNKDKVEILMKYFEVPRRAVDLRVIELGLY